MVLIYLMIGYIDTYSFILFKGNQHLFSYTLLSILLSKGTTRKNSLPILQVTGAVLQFNDPNRCRSNTSDRCLCLTYVVLLMIDLVPLTGWS